MAHYPDPIIQSPDFTQSYNSYSYCVNNPLKYFDPSGYKKSRVNPPGWSRLHTFLYNLWQQIRYGASGSGGGDIGDYSGSYLSDNSQSDMQYEGGSYGDDSNSEGGGQASGDNGPNSRSGNISIVQESGDPGKKVTTSGGVGQPGFGESFIPVWGSGRAAIDHFQNGNLGRGLLNTGIAVSDFFLVKSIGTAVGKGAWKFGSHSWSATRKWLGKVGYAEAGQPVDHWAISQATAKKYGLESVTNQPWNLMTFPSQSLHMRAGHGMMYLREPGYGIMGQIWYGTPIWPKTVIGSYGGRLGLE